MNWNLEIMVFEQRGKSWHPKKIRSSQIWKPTKNEVFSVIEVPPFRPSLNTGENILIRKSAEGFVYFSSSHVWLLLSR